VDRWATFDCYGTLIDWDGGIRAALFGLWPDVDPHRLVATFHAVEPGLEADAALTYRQVLSAAVPAVAEALDLEVPEGRASELAASLPSWPPFPGTTEVLAELALRGWRIAILSNTDPDYLDASLAAIGVPVDLRVVASTIGSYKPALGHWETFFALTGAERTRHVHVAASVFHDVQPCADLGLACVWINRSGAASDVPRAGELPDLRGLADTLERLVPA
jgi:2-haloacid dehalogenase